MRALRLAPGIVVLVLTGCSTVFGLDPGTVPGDTDDDPLPGVCEPGEFDEDEDGCGDEDDNCPHIANAEQADRDDDDVGDACDPHLDEPGDSILAFAGDFGRSHPELAIIGEWILDDEAARFRGNTMAEVGEIRYTRTQPVEPIIQFRAKLESSSGTTVNRVYAFADRVLETYVACDVVFVDPVLTYQLEEVTESVVAPRTQEAGGSTLPPFTLVFTPGSNLSCVVVKATEVTPLAINRKLSDRGGSVGVGVAGFDVVIDWVLVMDRLPPSD